MNLGHLELLVVSHVVDEEDAIVLEFIQLTEVVSECSSGSLQYLIPGACIVV